MLIGIDGNEANVGERVGVNVWAIEILRGLRRIRGQRRTRWVIYLSRPPVADMPEEGGNWKYRVIGPGRLWTRWRLPLDLYLYRPRPDVFLSLSHYAPKWAPCPRVVCIMDLSFLKFPEAFKPLVRWQLTNWTAESVRNAAHIITISEFNKGEIVKNYGYPEEKITVIYPGVSHDFLKIINHKSEIINSEIVELKKKYKLSDRYLVFVGTRQAKKNLGRLIEAFGKVRQKFGEVELVVAGKTWAQFENHKSEIINHISEKIRYVGYVSNDDLPDLMAGAEALVIPSLYEGFGIPAIEAMAAGTPVLASNATSLPEIIGDAGILFDPYDIKDMADKICRLLAMNKAERQRLVEKGKIRAGKFDWDKAAENIGRILEGVSLNER